MLKKITIAFLLTFYLAPAYPMTITAPYWAVADDKGSIIESRNENVIRSIASITKLMSAMVVLDAEQDLDEFIKPYTRRELIQLSIVKSDNRASQILCERYPGGTSKCVEAMNVKAKELGMKDTKFVEATGLRSGNVSTVKDLIKLVMKSADYPTIVQSSKMSQVKIQIRKKWLIFNNTNPIIGKRHDFIVSKTGWIRASGGCIVMMLDTDVGRRIVVVLGSRDTKTRIPEAEFIAQNFSIERDQEIVIY